MPTVELTCAKCGKRYEHFYLRFYNSRKKFCEECLAASAWELSKKARVYYMERYWSDKKFREKQKKYFRKYYRDHRDHINELKLESFHRRKGLGRGLTA